MKGLILVSLLIFLTQCSLVQLQLAPIDASVLPTDVTPGLCPPQACVTGKVWDSTLCKCRCINDCGVGDSCYPQIWNEKTCKCDCDAAFYAAVCPSYQYKDFQLCSCQCKERSHNCCYPKLWNNGKCQCLCPNVQKCPVNQQWNNDLCKCVCLSTQQCASPFTWSDTKCKCECAVQCPTNYILNPTTCKCACNKALAAPCAQQAGHYWDAASCSCKCKTVVCPVNFIQNPQTCKCECNNMNAEKCYAKNRSWDAVKCACGGTTTLPDYYNSVNPGVPLPP